MKFTTEEIQRIRQLNNVEEEFLFALELDEKYDINTSYWSFKNVKKDYIKELNLDINIANEKELKKIFSIMPELISKYNSYVSCDIQCQICEYNGSLIRFIYNPCEEAKLIVCKNIYNIRFIENPTKEMYEIGMVELQKPPYIKNMKLNNEQIHLLLTFKRILRQAYYEKSFYKHLECHFDKSFGETAVKKVATKGNTLGAVLLPMKILFKIVKGGVLTPFTILSKVLKIEVLKLLLFKIYNDMFYGVDDSICSRMKSCTLGYSEALEYILIKKLHYNDKKYRIGFRYM